MIFKGKAITVTLHDGGIAEMCFDLQGDGVNKFNLLTINELREAVEKSRLASGVQGMLVTSAKDVFIVGADISEFSELFKESEESIVLRLVDFNQIFNAVEELPFPTVCAINGAAMGGGLEMALACDYRVLAASARIGLPEVKLGINPGFGGTVRLPRLVGIDNALEWICAGNEYRADAALATGVVDAVVADEQLGKAARQLLDEIIAGDFDYKARRNEKINPVKLNDIERMMAFTTGKSVVAQQAGRNFPAPITAAKSMEKSSVLPRNDAIRVEAEHFAKLAKTTVADSLVGLFLNDQVLAKKAKAYAKDAAEITHSAVLGAGIMGGGIAYQSAFKKIPVIMKDIAEAGLDQGMAEASKLLAKRVNRGRMTAEQMAATLSNIRPSLSYDGFDKVDVVVEAVIENREIKKAVLAECETKVSETAVLASNTSTISITSLAESLARPENFCGMHFFNPVHQMPLVEVIRGEKSSQQTIATVVSYAKAIGKTPIVVNDCPGFYVNRVLFPYFAGFEMLVRDGVDYQLVDRTMERFGFPMGPAYLLDVVGIDTANHAGDVMAEGFPERMKPDFKSVTKLLFEQQRYGQKNNRGFYLYENDKRGKPIKSVDPQMPSLLAEIVAAPLELDEQAIIDRMMIPMCNEVVRCLEEGIVDSPVDADMGLIMGIGFPLFRGGPLRYMDHLGVDEFCRRAESLEQLGPLYCATDGLKAMAKEAKKFFS